MRERSAGGWATAFLMLWCGSALGLGLGEIEVQSGLNEPLKAVIPVRASGDELDSLRINVANSAAFDRAGLERADYVNTLSFSLQGDQLVVASPQPAREPFLTLLLEARWTGGTLLREYTVLLDPPGVAAARERAARERADRAAAPAYTPAPAPRPPQSTAAAPALRPAPGLPGPVAPAPQPAPPVSTPAREPRPVASTPDSYGPVQGGETLWSIAFRLRPDPRAVTMDQMQLALYRANPQAFEDGRITGLMKGAVLRVPPLAEIRTINAAEAKAILANARRAPLARRAESPPPAQPAPPVQQARPEPSPSPATAQATPPSGPAAEAPDAAPPEDPAETAVADASSPPPSAAIEDTTPAQEPADSSVPPAEAADPVETDPAEAAALDPDAAALPDETATETETGTEAAEDPASAAGPQPVPVPQPLPPIVETSDPVQEYLALARNLADQYLEQVPEWIEQARASPRAIPATGAAIVVLLGLLMLRARRRKGPAEAGRPAPSVGRPAKPAAAAPAKSLREQLEEDSRLAEVESSAPAPDPAPRKKGVTAPPAAVAPPPAPPPEPAAPAAPAAAPAPDFDLTASFAADTVQVNLDANDPIAEADFHLAYGLYDEAALLLKQAAQKQPNRPEIGIKLAETYFAAGRPQDFEETASGLKGRIADADWQKIAIMGQQLCPESGLFKDAGGGGSLGTDVDLAFEEAPVAQPAEQPAAPSAPAEAPAVADAGDAMLDFKLEDLELPAVEATPAAPPPAPAAEKNETLEFDLGDFQLPEPGASEVAAAAPPSAGGELRLEDMDLGGFDLSAEPAEVAAAAPPAASTSPDLGLESDADLGLGGAEDSPLGGDEAATKLDLARAYMDMGDNDMARSLLNEVLQQGNGDQKQEAQELLGRIPA